jgi:RNA polymerase subunit RPABC4/transcription elongation factor Spt4
MRRREVVLAQNVVVLCRECRGRILPDDKFCRHCDAVILRRYCPSCRKLVPDHTLICPYCGASAGEKPKARILQYPMNVAAMILILFVASLYFLWPDEKSNQVKSPAPPKIVEQPKVAQAPIAKPQPQPKSEVPVQKAVAVNATKNIEKGARLNLQGHALIKQGRYKEAVSTLHQAVETFPANTETIDYVFAQYNLAHSLRKIGKSEEAIPYLKRCIAYDSHNRMFQKELQAAQRDMSRN